jgi:hypothetical protein
MPLTRLNTPFIGKSREERGGVGKEKGKIRAKPEMVGLESVLKKL